MHEIVNILCIPFSPKFEGICDSEGILGRTGLEGKTSPSGMVDIGVLSLEDEFLWNNLLSDLGGVCCCWASSNAFGIVFSFNDKCIQISKKYYFCS